MNFFCHYIAGFTSTGGFKFTASTTADSSKPSPFTITPVSSTTTAPSGGFKFGAPTTAPSTGGFTMDKTEGNKSEAVSTTPFKFGVQNTNKDTVTSEAAAATSGGFKFGIAAAPSAEKSTAESTVQPSGGFKFTVASSDSSSTTTSKTETSTVTSAGGFKFGVQETGNSAKDTSKTAVGGFTFGQKPDSDSTKPAAGFGAFKSDTTATSAMTSGFAFGAAATSLPTKTESDKPTVAAAGISFTVPAVTKSDTKTEFKPGMYKCVVSKVQFTSYNAVIVTHF